MSVILKGMKRTERVIVALLVLLCAAGILFLRRPRTSGVTVGIYHHDEVYLTFDPEKDRVIELDGDYGRMVIEVKDGSWRVREVECPNHICEKMGWKTVEDLDPITCVPNGIVIMVVNDAE